tara:strand:+ start:2407 stop:2697 length:291 start_codon:yes stop_codon:yes gene_type:complete
MKDIKSMVIGFLMATCMFLFIGWTGSAEYGKYQVVEAKYEHDLFMINTATGEIYEFGDMAYLPKLASEGVKGGGYEPYKWHSLRMWVLPDDKKKGK